jgi:DNA-binding MarR family transcriptional regulator
MTAGRLADETGLSTGAMTTALDRLERAGYARRVRDPGDRRRVCIELTPAIGALDNFYSEHRRVGERLYRRYTFEQLELLLQFVREGRELNEEQAAALERRSREG